MARPRKTPTPPGPAAPSALSAPPYTRPPILRAFAALGVPFRLPDEGALRGLGRVWERLDTIPDPRLPGVIVRRCAAAGAPGPGGEGADAAPGASTLRRLYVAVLHAALGAVLAYPAGLRDAGIERVTGAYELAARWLVVPDARAVEPLRDAFVALVPRTDAERLAAALMQAAILADADGPLADLDALCGSGIGYASAVCRARMVGDAALARRLWESAGRELREALDVALQTTTAATRDAFRGAVVADTDTHSDTARVPPL